MNEGPRPKEKPQTGHLVLYIINILEFPII